MRFFIHIFLCSSLTLLSSLLVFPFPAQYKNRFGALRIIRIIHTDINSWPIYRATIYRSCHGMVQRVRDFCSTKPP